MLMQCTQDLWSCTGFILDVSFLSHDKLPLVHPTLWLRRFNRIQIIMGNSTSMVHNHHLHQGPVALQTVLFQNLSDLHCYSPTGAWEKRYLFSVLILPKPYGLPNHMDQATGLLHLLQSLSCSEPYSTLAVICATQYRARMIFLTMECIVSRAQKTN